MRLRPANFSTISDARRENVLETKYVKRAKKKITNLMINACSLNYFIEDINLFVVGIIMLQYLMHSALLNAQCAS